MKKYDWVIGLMPLAPILAYILFTLLVYFFGPISWDMSNGVAVGLYMATVLTITTAGYLCGVTRKKAASDLPSKSLIFIGAVSSCVLLFPSVYVYTGKLPWQLVEVLANQRATYMSFLSHESSGLIHPFVSFLRIVSFPFVFLVIPLGVLHWRKIGIAGRLLVGMTVASWLLFSFFRGTNREILYLAVDFLSAGLLLMGRTAVSGKLRRVLVARRWSLTIGSIAVVMLSILAVNLFVDRLAGRYIEQQWGSIEACPDPRICADPSKVWLSYLSPKARFAVTMIDSYAAQGYFGLSLAIGKDFRSTLGTGHSPLVARVYSKITGDTSLYQNSFTSRISAEPDKWDDSIHWSTLMTWLANDVGFAGALVIVGMFAFIWGLAWKDAVFAGNDKGAIVFCLMMQLFVWLPSNNQLMQSPDSYFALIVWTGFWLFGRSGIAKSTLKIGR